MTNFETAKANTRVYISALAAIITAFALLHITGCGDDSLGGSSAGVDDFLNSFAGADTAAAKPYFTSPPSPFNGSTDVGKTHKLTVDADVRGEGELSYQWYINALGNKSDGTPANNGTDKEYFATINTAGTYFFYVVVTNTNRAIRGRQTAACTSGLVILTVNAMASAQTPVITPLSQQITINAGQTINLSTAASVTDGGTLSYQWYENTENKNEGGTLITGATDTSITVSANDINTGTSYYYVTVTNTITRDGTQYSATNTSDVAVVTVNDKINAQSPIIEEQPSYSDTTITIPNNLTLNIKARTDDGGTLSYQWYRHGNTSAIANTSQLTVSTQTPGTYHYYAIVTNTITGSEETGNTTATAISNTVTVTVGGPSTKITIKIEGEGAVAVAYYGVTTESITGPSSEISVPAGIEITLTALPDGTKDFKFINWKRYDPGNENQPTIIDQNPITLYITKAVTAVFEQDPPK